MLVLNQTIYLTPKEYDEIEKHLSEGTQFEGIGPEEHREILTAKFPDGVEVDITVRNELTEDGGAWLDPCVFLDDKQFIVGDPASSLTENFDFDDYENGIIYKVRIEKNETMPDLQ